MKTEALSFARVWHNVVYSLRKYADNPHGIQREKDGIMVACFCSLQRPKWGHHGGRIVMTAKYALCLICSLVFMICPKESRILAQDWPSDDSVEEVESTSARQSDGEVSSPMQAGGRSLKDSVVFNPRNKVGFSLGLFGLYDNIDLGSNEQSDDESFDMMILPTAFVNLEKGKHNFTRIIHWNKGY